MLLNRQPVLLSRTQRSRVMLLAIGTLIAAALEMVGIGAIPAFVALWSDPERLFARLPDGALTTGVRAMDVQQLTVLSAAVLAGLFVVKNGYLAALLYAEGRILRDVSTTLSSRLFRAYLHGPYVLHLQRNPAELIRNTSTEVSEAVQLIRSVMALVREGLVLAVVLVLLLLVDPLVSLSVFMLLGAATAAFYLAVRKSLARSGELIHNHRARQLQAIQQGLGAIKVAKVLGREPHLIRAFDIETEAKELHGMFYVLAVAVPRLFLEVVAVSAVLLVAVVFMLLERPAQSMLPVVALLAVAVVRLVPALNAITVALALMKYQRPALDVVRRDLAALETVDVQYPAEPIDSLPLRGAITLDNVHYQYPGSRVAALQSISCEIRAGQAVAFIGRSGAGKSTLVDVVLGLLVPTSGRVCVDGRNVHTAVRAWQRQIGYVPQDIYLTDDTIRRNIAFGLPDDEINESAVERAQKAARLDDFVSTLPEGLDTVIGDRGVRISGGQRQRIGIARALYHDPGVLVLDEATSALDNETEHEVIAAIARLRRDRTIITIAHRLTTVIGSDLIFLLDNGRITDQGDFSELAMRNTHLRIGSSRDGAE